MRVYAIHIAAALAWLLVAMSFGAFVVLAGQRSSPDWPVGLLVGSVATWIWLVVGAGLLTRKAWQAAEWWSAMRELARKLGGRLSAGPERRLEWLDRHWLGELRPIDVQQSAHGGSIALVAHGYPLLVVFDPLPILGRRKARFGVFLACSISASLPGVDRWAIEAQAWFERRGFTLEWSEAGLRITAARTVVRAMDDALERAMDDEYADVPYAVDAACVDPLVAAIHALATTAAQLHAEPVVPIP